MSDMIENRDENLDMLLGIINKPKDNTPTERTRNLPTKPIPDDLDKGLDDNLRDLDGLFNISEEILYKAKDMVESFGKSRDIEVAGSLIKSMIELKKERRETLKDKFGGNDDSKKGGSVTNNNIVFQESFKELMNMIPKPKPVIVVNESKENKDDDEAVDFELCILRDDSEEVCEFIIKELQIPFDKEPLREDDTDYILLYFDTAKDMNKVKFELIDKFSEDILQ